jgi:hypothetical protein
MTATVTLFGIRRVVLGENATFIGVSSRHLLCGHNPLFSTNPSICVLLPLDVGGEDFLISRGVEIINLNSTECKDLMAKFIAAKPEVWNEDIGEE